MDVFIRDRRTSITLPDKAYPCVVLERDNWNDFSYYTLFKAQLRLAPGGGSSTVKSLGDVKIMKPNQTEGMDSRLNRPGFQGG